MAASHQTVLYEYKTTALFWLIPLFIGLSCMVLAMSIFLPMYIPSANDPSNRVSLLIGWIAGLGMPPFAILLWLLVPAVTTLWDPAQRAVVVEYRRPLWRSAKTYRLDEIEDIRPFSAGRHSYSMGMILKGGRYLRLEYGSSSDLQGRRDKAARIKATIGLGPREVKV